MKIVFDSKNRINKRYAYKFSHEWKNATSDKFWAEDLIFESSLYLKLKMS